jgi:signal transduction histidine kinase
VGRARHVKVDTDVEWSAYDVGAALLSPTRITTALEKFHRFASPDESAGEWLLRPIFKTIFATFGQVSSYDAEDLRDEELPSSVRLVRDVIYEAQGYFDYVSVHYWDIVRHQRSEILSHFANRFAETTELAVYEMVGRWYNELGRRGPTLIQAVEANSHGSIDFTLTAEPSLKHAREGVLNLHFPQEETLTLSRALSFRPTFPGSAESLNQELDGALRKSAGQVREDMARFAADLQRVLQREVTIREAAHISLGLIGWETTIGLLPYLFVGIKYNSLFGISFSAPSRHDESLRIPPSLIYSLRGLVRGFGAALSHAQRDLTIFYRSRVGFIEFLRHDAQWTIDTIKTQLMQVRTRVQPEQAESLEFVSREATYLHERIELFVRRPFPPERVCKDEDEEDYDLCAVFRSIAQADHIAGTGLGTVTVLEFQGRSPFQLGSLVQEEISSGIVPRVSPTPMRLILDNLFSNALKFPVEQTIIVVSVCAADCIGYVDVSVADNGTPFRPNPERRSYGHIIIDEIVAGLKSQYPTTQFLKPAFGAVGLQEKKFIVRIPVKEDWFHDAKR